MILADDMGWSDLGCYGSEIGTPNLDRLAKGGIRFTQFHNTAKCFPSRACLLTGLYAQQCGMDKKPAAFQNCVTLAEVLRSAGYRTLMAGKPPTEPTIPTTADSTAISVCATDAATISIPACNAKAKANRRRNATTAIGASTVKPTRPTPRRRRIFTTTDYFTNNALQYLDNCKDEDDPFFLYLAYTAPHDPLMAWPQDIEKYADTYKVGYEKIRAARRQKQMEMGLNRRRFPPSPKRPTSRGILSPKKSEKKKPAKWPSTRP